MMRTNCSFSQAQKSFADFLGSRDFEAYTQRFHNRTEPEQETDDEPPEEPITEVEIEDLTDEHRAVLQESAEFYSNLLLSRKEKFRKVLKYLNKRGLDDETIEKFKIGFCPSFQDDEFKGRALLAQHVATFRSNLPYYQLFRRTGLLRLLDDETQRAYYYYRRHIDLSFDEGFGTYADYFVNRITFPISNINGQVEGMIARRLDNRGIRWLKQKTDETYLKPMTWLYGIDKSVRGIREYLTVIIVEGIFDFFAFYNISENKDRPIVVSTLGTVIGKTAIMTLLDLGVKNLIIAFDWDPAGKRSILKAAEEFKEVNISFLGSLKEDEDPADRLKDISSKISNFGIRHLQKGMKVKSQSGKPVMSSFLVQRQKKKKLIQDEILLKPAEILTGKPIEKDPEDFWYRINDILVLLSYDHKNRAELNQKLKQIRSFLDDPQKHQPAEEERDQFFSLPRKFTEDEHHIRIGPALILHLRIAIEQQKRKRKIKEADSTIAEWLNTSRKTIFKYKAELKQANLLNIDKTGRTQKLSVKLFSGNADKIHLRKEK
jgi:DNA primase catalytic core